MRVRLCPLEYSAVQRELKILPTRECATLSRPSPIRLLSCILVAPDLRRVVFWRIIRSD
jgi:hypothetical protein